MKTLKLFFCITLLFLTSCDKSNPIDSASTAGGPHIFQSIKIGTKNNLHSVFFINSRIGYIAGDSGLVLKTSNGGTVWTAATPVTKRNLFCVIFASIDTGYAFGDSVTVLKTTDGGSNWRNLFPSIPWDYHLRTGYCISGQYFETAGYKSTWKSQNGGISLQGFIGSPGYYRSMKRASDSTGIVVGDSGLIQRRNTLSFSNRWNTVTSPTSNNLNSLVFINNNIGLAVGDNGTLIQTENNGNNWQLMPSISREKLNDIHFLNPSNGVVIGNNAVLYATSDSGKSWRNYNILTQILTQANLNSVCSIDGQRRIIVGDGGTILKEY
jgi:photosystem II stability/assembly factor-like uncharacterized protein